MRSLQVTGGCGSYRWIWTSLSAGLAKTRPASRSAWHAAPISANTPPHRRRDGGPGSNRFTGCHAQARHQKPPVRRVAEGRERIHDLRRDLAQTVNDLSRVVGPAHMGVAGSKAAVRSREVRSSSIARRRFATASSKRRLKRRAVPIPLIGLPGRARGLRRREASNSSIAISGRPAHSLSRDR
jgi:hypothetical protein